MSHQKPSSPQENTESSFSIDINPTKTTDVPSITRLLNRKSLKNLDSSVTTSTPSEVPLPSTETPIEISGISIVNLESPAAFERTQVASPTISLEVPPSTSDPSPSPLQEQGSVQQKDSPQIQVSRRKTPKPHQKLILWDLNQLKKSIDPLAKGLTLSFQKGIQSALFLGIISPPAGGTIPQFLSSAAVNPKDKLELWTGLKWDPLLLPEFWNHFIQAGHIELAPPGTVTNNFSYRNIMRTGFGITKTEWLLLVRVGNSEACRGIVALVSSQGLLPQIQDALSLLATPMTAK